MAAQRERARAAGAKDAEAAWSTYGGVYADLLRELGPTAFIGYDATAAETTVVALVRDGERVDEPILSGITLFFFAYILLLLTGTLVVAWDDVGFTSAFTASLTCISNVGPAFGSLGPTSNFAALSNVSKVFLSLNMLLGRLEIMPLLLLLFPSLWKKR